MAIKELVKEGFLRKEAVEFDFYGRALSLVKQISYKIDMTDIVSFHGVVPYKESIQRQKESDILLLLEWMNSRAKGVYTGKIFEYLGAKKQILLIGLRGGFIDRLLRKAGAGVLGSTRGEVKTLIMP